MSPDSLLIFIRFTLYLLFHLLSHPLVALKSCLFPGWPRRWLRIAVADPLTEWTKKTRHMFAVTKARGSSASPHANGTSLYAALELSEVTGPLVYLYLTTLDTAGCSRFYSTAIECSGWMQQWVHQIYVATLLHWIGIGHDCVIRIRVARESGCPPPPAKQSMSSYLCDHLQTHYFFFRGRGWGGGRMGRGSRN